MSNLQEKILTHVSKVLSAEDLVLWERVLSKTPEEFLGDIFSFVDSSTESVIFLNENLKKKAAAIKDGDESLLNEAFADQKNFLQKLTNITI